MVEPALVVGTAGMLMLLVAFVLNLVERLAQDDAWYTGLNFVGGGLLAFYAYALNSYPFLVLELVWTFSAGYKLLDDWRE